MNLAIHIANYAKGAYEDFDGEPDVAVDAVDLTTVHKAKGLEWPVVFVPSLTKRRFPSAKTGQTRDWLVPRHLFDAARYEGSDPDERRLFYVAMTRARDWLSLSRHERIRNRVAASPYHQEVTGHTVNSALLPLPQVEPIVAEESDEPLTLTFSELAAYRTCGFAYRLRNYFGFQPLLAPELGYGKAVHHIMRAVAEYTQRHGQPPDPQQLDQLFDTGFFLPAASRQHTSNSKRRPAVWWIRISPGTRRTCSVSGRRSGRSSCTCRPRSSVAGLTSSWTGKAGTSNPSPSWTTSLLLIQKQRMTTGCSLLSTPTLADARDSTSEPHTCMI